MSKVIQEVFDIVAVEEGKEVFKIESARSVAISYERGRVFVDVEDVLFDEELFDAVMNGEYSGRHMQVTLESVLSNDETQDYDKFKFELKDAEIVGMHLSTTCENPDGKAFPVHIKFRAHVSY